MRPSITDYTLVYCVKDGKHEDAAEFLGLYLDALNEELVQLHTYTSADKPASAPGVEVVEEEARSFKGQTEVRERDYTPMRQSLYFFYTAPDSDADNVRIGKFNDSPFSDIFGGRSRSTVRVPSQPDTVTIEAWRSLQLNIQVCSSFFLSFHLHRLII